MVDLVGRLWVEVGDGVVADRGQVDDRIEADEVLGLYVADVLRQGRRVGRRVAAQACREQVGI